MVTIGTIEYNAKITGADAARQKTDDLQRSQEQLANTSADSAGELTGVAGTIRTAGADAEEAGRQVGIFDHDLRQLRSTGEGVKGTLGDITGTLKGGLGGGGGAAAGGGILSGLIGGGTVSAASLISGSVAASALIVGGVAAAALIVGTVATGSLIAGTLSAAAVIAGTVAAGSLIVGTIAAAALIVGTVATDSVIVGTISAAALIVGTIAAGSLIVGTIAAGSIIVGTVGIQELIDIAQGGTGPDFAHEAGADFAEDNPDAAAWIEHQFRDSTAFEAGQATREVWEEIKDFDVPGLQSGGTVGRTGIAEVHEGEAVLPPALVDTLTSTSEPRRQRSGGVAESTGPTPAPTVRIGNLTVEITGDFDPTDMSRRNVRRLADMLVDALGDKTTSIAGSR